jgi:hypothetical protein
MAILYRGRPCRSHHFDRPLLIYVVAFAGFGSEAIAL